MPNRLAQKTSPYLDDHAFLLGVGYLICGHGDLDVDPRQN